MKKILFYLLAAGAVFSVGCSKDATVDTPVAEGKYTLTEISAELDATRTGLGTGNVVNWSNKDRIAIFNTTTGISAQYELVSGAGTPIGTFRPVNNAISYTNASDVKAVYPAIAASLTGNKISVSINQNYLDLNSQAWLDTYGVTSYTKDSPYAFTHNDIKVSYKFDPQFSGSTTARPNFKFKQLGVWCSFVFDFTANPDLSRNKMISMSVEAPNAISGTAEIDFTDPMAPTLKAGTENTINWEFATVSSMNTVITRSFMMFPNVTSNDQLKISVKSDGHNITLWNTPSKDLVGGTVLRFPINIDKDFQRGAAGDDLAYVATENTANPFIYYGTANCYLMTGTGSGSVNIDVTPYVANRFYEQQTQESGTALPASAAVIWKESTMGTISVGNIVTAQKRFNVTVNNGYGNALIGVYSGSNGTGDLLWSYHIWKTEDDPEITVPYNVTNSGSYAVMSMALGATKKSTYASSLADKAKSSGLYYQWGRKDPLGRPSALPASGDSYVAVQDKSGSPLAANYWTNTATNVKQLTPNSGGILDGVNVDADGFELDRYMIDWAVKNPTVFVKVANGDYNNDWVGVTNNNLWGNPDGYNYPEKSQLRGRSVFDPCPAGYHVAPKDLWINFSKTRNNTTVPDEFNTRNPGTSIANTEAPYTEAVRGYSFYVNDWKTGIEDFYPASGFRSDTSGALNGVGTSGYAWSSSPYAAGNANGGFLRFGSGYVNPLVNTGRAGAFPVRCVQN